MTAPVLGFYQPGSGWLFRAPLGLKYLILLAVTLPPLFLRDWRWTLVAAAVAVAILSSSGLDLRRVFALGRTLWIILVITAGYHLVLGMWTNAILYPGNILTAVLAARIVTLTTPTTEIVDGIEALAGRIPGVDGATVGLAVGIMLRSIPYLIGSIDDARDAMRARGQQRNLLRLLVPVTLGAVGYAERTAEALTARGLGERQDQG